MTSADRLLLAGAAVALMAGAVAAWLLAAPQPLSGESVPTPGIPVSIATSPPTEAAPSGELVIDVQGAVLHPGIQVVPAGARVADALTAAGGYAPDVDVVAASQQINLAAPLSDGQQILVPQLGAGPVAQAPTDGTSGTAGSGAHGGGPINVNTATPEQLDALPGIGPVTVQKIIAGRQEQPFGSLEEMVERKVINRGQLESIRELAVAS